MLYLVQALEEYTGAALSEYTKIFRDKDQAYTYASLLISNKAWAFGYDYANILELEIESDPLSELSSDEYKLATCPA